MHDSFQCEHCHDLVPALNPAPECQSCGTTYLFDTAKGSYYIARSRAQFYDNIAGVLVLLGIVGSLPAHKPLGIAVLGLFAGFALHYWNGVRCGVLSSRIPWIRWRFTAYKSESIASFYLAAVIEGAWVLVLFIALLILF